MRVSVGRVEDLPTDRAVGVGDGSVVVVRNGDSVVAFRNRCLHEDSSLVGGRVLEGRLACPQHFWLYELPEGRHTGGRGTLTGVEVEVDDLGEVVVEVPDPAPRSIRDRLLAHVRRWERRR